MKDEDSLAWSIATANKDKSKSKDKGKAEEKKKHSSGKKHKPSSD
jgi:hypothetical protein